MNTIELTPAELELIANQRQAEAELEAKKQEAIEVQFKKDKLAADNRLAKIIGEGNAQTEAAKEYAAALGSAYTLKTEMRTATEKAYKRDYNSRETLEEYVVTGEYSHAEIVRGGYTVKVIEHVSYSGYRYSKSHGHKMYVHGAGIDYKTQNRGYKNTKKVNELVNDTIEAIKAKKAHENKQKSAVEQVVAELSAQFPTATVVAGRDYRANVSKRQYTEYDAITVKLENGITIKYQVHADKSLTKMSIEYPKVEATDLINALSNIKF